MKFRHRHTDDISINLTPLIDVVFLLLIFFMVSTTFTKESQLDINLPEASANTFIENDESIVIQIDKSGVMNINGDVVSSRSVNAVISTLKKASGNDNSRALVISADALTPHQAVVTAMEAAGKLGFVKLSIETQNTNATES